MAARKEMMKDGAFFYIITCEHILGYETRCKNCGEPIFTEKRTELKECYKCKSKDLGTPTPKRCTEWIKTAFGVLDKKKEDAQHDKRIDTKMLKDIPTKNMKNKNAPDEWYCDIHAELHR